jgi:ubiquinone biosynthesis UbiH/UbiF/VisC/COQ6 family hydroxylase
MNTFLSFDIAIVGGGLNGAALALALKASPYRVALLDPHPPVAPAEAWDARIYAFSPNNVAWLQGLGGWNEQVRAQAVQAMRIHGDGGSRLHFDALDGGLSELAFIAENGRLQYALWQALRQTPTITCIAAKPLAVVWGEQRHVLVMPDGQRIEADLLVAAEGANSWLRQQAGIEVDVEDYHHSGVVANFETEKPHRGTAYQWFSQDSVLAYLPLPGRRISIVWSSPTDKVPERVAMTADEFAAAVAEAGSYALGRLTQITPQAAFPLKRRRAREWVRPGLVLLGDAAHTVHPLAGQGVNLGFRDSRLLAQLLSEGGNPGEIGRLHAYALRRMEDVASMQFTTGGLKKLFNNTSPALAWLRNTGLALTDSQDWLKQALMRHAVQ